MPANILKYPHWISLLVLILLGACKLQRPLQEKKLLEPTASSQKVQPVSASEIIKTFTPRLTVVDLREAEMTLVSDTDGIVIGVAIVGALLGGAIIAKIAAGRRQSAQASFAIDNESGLRSLDYDGNTLRRADGSSLSDAVAPGSSLPQLQTKLPIAPAAVPTFVREASELVGGPLLQTRLPGEPIAVLGGKSADDVLKRLALSEQEAVVSRVDTQNGPVYMVYPKQWLDSEASQKLGRRIPPVNAFQTPGSPLPRQATTLPFADSEIVRIHEVKSISAHKSPEEGLGARPLPVMITTQGRIVVPQCNPKSCSYAATSMLILDHKPAGYYPQKVAELYHGGGRFTSNLADDLSGEGLKPLAKTQSVDSKEAYFSWLDQEISRDGSAIINLNGHFVVVDAVKMPSKTIEFRDPYHWWSLELSQAGFWRWQKGGGSESSTLTVNILQVAK